MEKIVKKVLPQLKISEISYFLSLNKNQSQNSPINILFLGEGNFSFSLSFIKILYKLIQEQQTENKFDIITSSFDTQEELLQKYPEFEQIHQKLVNYSKKHNNLNISIMHSIDATNISKSLQQQINKNDLNGENFQLKFDKIFFNHPHTGQDDLRRNSSLVSHFLYSTQTCLKNKNTEIWISLLQGQYERWQIEAVLPYYNLQRIYTEPLPNLIYENGFEARRNLVGSNFQNSNIAKTFDKMKLQSYNFVFSQKDSDFISFYKEFQQKLEEEQQNQQLQQLQQNNDKNQKQQNQEEFQFFCQFCNKGFRKEQGKKTHEMEEHIKKDKNYQDKKKKKQKKNDQKQTNQNPDNQNDQIIKDQQQQNQQIQNQQQEEQQQFICKECNNRVFKSEAGYKDHLLYKHSGDKSVKKPEFAGKILKIIDAETFKTLDKNNDKEQTICKICFQDYETPEELQKHKLWLTPDLKDQIIVKCQFCERIFKEDREKQAHLFYCKQNPENIKK